MYPTMASANFRALAEVTERQLARSLALLGDAGRLPPVLADHRGPGGELAARALPARSSDKVKVTPRPGSTLWPTTCGAPKRQSDPGGWPSSTPFRAP